MKSQNKYIAAVLLSALALTSIASPSLLQAEVTFVFDVAPGSGSFFSAAALADLEAAGEAVGSYFENNATLYIEVGTNTPGGNVLAGGGTFYANSSGEFNRGLAGFKIEDEINHNNFNGGVDGTLDFTSTTNWGFGNTIGSTEFDFLATAMHELFHVVGFSSAIEEDGSSAFSTNGWNEFDRFVGDSQGGIIDQSSNNLDIFQNRWDAASIGGTGDGGLEWIGANAIAANGGNPVYLYSPSDWSDGSSGSHLDGSIDRLILESGDGPGLGTRTLSAVEVGMFQDLYGVSAIVPIAIPEPGSASILALSAMGLLIRRRRR